MNQSSSSSMSSSIQPYQIPQYLQIPAEALVGDIKIFIKLRKWFSNEELKSLELLIKFDNLVSQKTIFKIRDENKGFNIMVNI